MPERRLEAQLIANPTIKISALWNVGLTLTLQLYIKEGDDIAARSCREDWFMASLDSPITI
ncbi:hypothetical protein ACCT20_36585, partial [Rhizobium ruizarguesonis]